MIQIVGKMHDGKPVIFDNPVNKPVEVDDVLLNEQGEYLRVILDRQRLSSVKVLGKHIVPVISARQRLSSVVIDVPNPKHYEETIDSLRMDTRGM